MMSDAMLRLLRKAEAKLNIDGLYLRLQSDGSGCVSTFDNIDIFRFDSFALLAAWLKAPRLVSYDEEGKLVCDANGKDVPPKPAAGVKEPL
jgi:hypothetical protein